MVIVWALTGIAGLAFYNGELYNYYFAFLFPVPFLLLSLIIFVKKKQKYRPVLQDDDDIEDMQFYGGNKPDEVKEKRNKKTKKILGGK